MGLGEDGVDDQPRHNVAIKVFSYKKSIKQVANEATEISTRITLQVTVNEHRKDTRTEKKRRIRKGDEMAVT